MIQQTNYIEKEISQCDILNHQYKIEGTEFEMVYFQAETEPNWFFFEKVVNKKVTKTYQINSNEPVDLCKLAAKSSTSATFIFKEGKYRFHIEMENEECNLHLDYGRNHFGELNGIITNNYCDNLWVGSKQAPSQLWCNKSYGGHVTLNLSLLKFINTDKAKRCLSEYRYCYEGSSHTCGREFNLCTGIIDHSTHTDPSDLSIYAFNHEHNGKNYNQKLICNAEKSQQIQKEYQQANHCEISLDSCYTTYSDASQKLNHRIHLTSTREELDSTIDDCQAAYDRCLAKE